MRTFAALVVGGLALSSPVLSQEAPNEALPVLPDGASMGASTSAPADSAALQTWTVDTVEIVGRKTVERSVLANAVRMVPGDVLTENALADRQRESLRALMALGLLDDASLDFTETAPGRVRILVTVREQPLVANVMYEGNKKLSDKDLKEMTRLSSGAQLSPAAMERDRQAILRGYREKGYLLATVRGERLPVDADGQIPLRWTIEEGSKVRVGRILISGNAQMKPLKIRKVMRVKEKRWWRSGEFLQDSLTADLESIRDLYREKGFLDARVDSSSVVYRPDGKHLDVRLQVTEGPRYVRGRITFTGFDIFTEKQLRTQLMLDSGDVMNQKKLEAEEQNLRNLYLEEGRIFVQIKPVRTFRDSIVDLVYSIQEGPPATVAEVTVLGNTKTRDKVIRRELRVFPGDLYRQSNLMRSFREIMQLNYFDNVLPDLAPREDGLVDVSFKVAEKERGTGTLSAGAAFSQSDGFVGTFGTQIPNILGTGRQLNLNLEFGEYKQSYSVGGSEPWLMDTPTRLGGSLFYTHQVNQYYEDRDITQYGFSLNLGRRLKWPDDYFSVSGGYTFSFNSYGSSGDREGVLQTDGIESSPSVTISRDDRDLPLFPTSGSFYQLYLRRVGGWAGGSFDYTEGRAKIKWFFPTIEKLVLGVHADMGVLDGSTIQAKDLYEMGGSLGYQGMLRGYSPGSVGAGRVGRSFVSGTAELRYPVADQVFYLLAFADVGNVFGPALRSGIDNSNVTLGNAFNDIDLGTLKKDYGFGFRLNIPMMGILGFDFAWGLDPNENLYGEPTENKGFHSNFVIEAPF